MPKNFISFRLENRRCSCLVPEGKPARLFVLCGWETEALAKVLSEDAPETMFFSTEIDGGRDFTPWAAEPVRQGEVFSGGGEAYLRFLTETALPYLREHFGAPAEREKTAILGYSLGGLFALWALTKTEKFGAGASISGSLWYPGLLEYLSECPPTKDTQAYLSLGDREPFGGPPVMRTVGICTERAKKILTEYGCNVFFEWNPGGHGKGVEKRWQRAAHRLLFMMQNSAEK